MFIDTNSLVLHLGRVGCGRLISEIVIRPDFSISAKTPDLHVIAPPLLNDRPCFEQEFGIEQLSRLIQAIKDFDRPAVQLQLVSTAELGRRLRIESDLKTGVRCHWLLIEPDFIKTRSTSSYDAEVLGRLEPTGVWLSKRALLDAQKSIAVFHPLAVRLSMFDGEATIRVERPSLRGEMDSSQLTYRAGVAGRARSFSLGADVLASVLRRLRQGTGATQVLATEDDSAVAFRCDGFTYVMAPLPAPGAELDVPAQ